MQKKASDWPLPYMRNWTSDLDASAIRNSGILKNTSHLLFGYRRPRRNSDLDRTVHDTALLAVHRGRRPVAAYPPSRLTTFDGGPAGGHGHKDG